MMDYQEENDGYVVFEWNIHWSAGKKGGGVGGRRPPLTPLQFIIINTLFAKKILLTILHKTIHSFKHF